MLPNWWSVWGFKRGGVFVGAKVDEYLVVSKQGSIWLVPMWLMTDLTNQSKVKVITVCLCLYTHLMSDIGKARER